MIRGVLDALARLATSAGSSLVGFIQAGAGAVARTVQSKLRETISVKDFGAVGDGSTDDTTAIQAAITYASTINGRLRIPAAAAGQYYKTTAPLTATGPIEIVGDGANATQIIGTGLSAGQYVLDFNCAAVDVVEFVTLKGLTLRSNNGTPNALRLKNVSYVRVDDIRAYGVTDGMLVTGTRCFSHFVDGFTCYTVSGKGLLFNGYTGGGQMSYSNCTFAGTHGVEVTSDSAINNLAFDACNWEGCTSNGFQVAGDVDGLSITAPRTENGAADDFVMYPASGKVVAGLSITGGFFQTNSGANYPISLGGNTGIVRGFNISGNYASNATNALVRLNGDGESGVVTGNYINSATGTATSTQRPGVVVFANENTAGKLTEYWGSATWSVVQNSFTPGVSFGGGTTGITYTTQVGAYQRIGNRVDFSLNIVLSNKGSSTGQAKVTGLPVTSSSTSSLISSVVIKGAALSSITGHLEGYVENNATTITLDYLGTGTPTNLDDTNFSNTTQLVVSGSYKV